MMNFIAEHSEPGASRLHVDLQVDRRASSAFDEKSRLIEFLEAEWEKFITEELGNNKHAGKLAQASFSLSSEAIRLVHQAITDFLREPIYPEKSSMATLVDAMYQRYYEYAKIEEETESRTASRAGRLYLNLILGALVNACEGSGSVEHYGQVVSILVAYCETYYDVTLHDGPRRFHLQLVKMWNSRDGGHFDRIEDTVRYDRFGRAQLLDSPELQSVIARMLSASGQNLPYSLPLLSDSAVLPNAFSNFFGPSEKLSVQWKISGMVRPHEATLNRSYGSGARQESREPTLDSPHLHCRADEHQGPFELPTTPGNMLLFTLCKLFALVATTPRPSLSYVSPQQASSFPGGNVSYTGHQSFESPTHPRASAKFMLRSLERHLGVAPNYGSEHRREYLSGELESHVTAAGLFPQTMAKSLVPSEAEFGNAYRAAPTIVPAVTLEGLFRRFFLRSFGIHDFTRVLEPDLLVDVLLRPHCRQLPTSIHSVFLETRFRHIFLGVVALSNIGVRDSDIVADKYASLRSFLSLPLPREFGITVEDLLHNQCENIGSDATNKSADSKVPLDSIFAHINTTFKHHAIIRVIVALAGSASVTPFTFFDPIPWLGCQHNGHPVSLSLSSYVLLRYPRIKTRNEHLALWQSTLTFGVLEALTGLPVPESFLLIDQPGDSVAISARHVTLLLYFWSDLLLLQEDEVIANWLHHAMDILASASAAIELSFHEQDLVFSGDVLPTLSIFDGAGVNFEDIRRMFCSMKTLLDAVFSMISRIRQDRHGGMPPEDPTPKEEWTTLRDLHLSGPAYTMSDMLYKSTLAEMGWCIPSITTSTPSRSLTLLAYMTNSPEMPFFGRSQQEHLSCVSRCVTHNIDTSKYTTLHTTSSCTCQHLSPTLTQVSDILLSGGIPVVIFTGTSLQVRRASEGPYVALSHIWADGLGSTTEKGIPLCQIWRITSYACTLVTDGAFWLDSLCVPNAKKLRTRAIQRMARTYRDAATVVVFDTAIRASCSSLKSHIHNMLTINTSLWMQRIWTLQETLVAREIYFEMSDGLVSERALGRQDNFGLDVLAVTAHGNFRECRLLHGGECMREEGLETENSWTRFGRITFLLKNRHTSKPEDETLAIAGLFKVDTRELIKYEDAESRMQEFLLRLRQIPFSITSRPCSRLRSPGFRWAPRSLTEIGGVGDGFEVPAINGECTREGFTSMGEITMLRFPDTWLDCDPSSDAPATYISARLPECASPFYVGITPNPQDEAFLCNALLIPPHLRLRLASDVNKNQYRTQLETALNTEYTQIAAVYIDPTLPNICEFRGVSNALLPCSMAWVHTELWMKEQAVRIIEGEVVSSGITVT